MTPGCFSLVEDATNEYFSKVCKYKLGQLVCVSSDVRSARLSNSFPQVYQIVGLEVFRDDTGISVTYLIDPDMLEISEESLVSYYSTEVKNLFTELAAAKA